MSEHTKEPWQADRVGDGVMICESSNGLMIEMEFGDEGIANASRIVACVNACAGVPTFMLEMDINGQIQHMRETLQQRDELAKAMQTIATTPGSAAHHRIAQQVLEKVKT